MQLQLMDLAPLLNEDDTDAKVIALYHQAKRQGNTAVCIAVSSRSHKR